jgi:hypothetical protein
VQDYEFNSFNIDFLCSPPDNHSVVEKESPAKIEDDTTPEADPSTSDNHSQADHQSIASHGSQKQKSPLDAVVLLAGEVPGLKPPAVARSPKPPRLFIIDRNGEANEVVSSTFFQFSMFLSTGLYSCCTVVFRAAKYPRCSFV